MKGRPKKENPRDKIIRLRLTNEEYEKLKNNPYEVTMVEFIRICIRNEMDAISAED